jgi:hypothetical protein
MNDLGTAQHLVEAEKNGFICCKREKKRKKYCIYAALSTRFSECPAHVICVAYFFFSIRFCCVPLYLPGILAVLSHECPLLSSLSWSYFHHYDFTIQGQLESVQWENHHQVVHILR